MRLGATVGACAGRCDHGPATLLSRPDGEPDDGASQGGSAALLSLLGGGLALLIAVVPIVAVADLVVSRGRAQTAADAAALAALTVAAGDADKIAADAARRNGGGVVACCGDDPSRRTVTVEVPPTSRLLAAAVPQVKAHAVAELVATWPAGVGAVAPGPLGARIWPLDAPITSRFGMRVHPLTGSTRLHAGLDLGAPTGTPIAAAAAGTVRWAGPMGGYGNVVDIAHNDGTVTRYAHQHRVLVSVGQAVAAGQVIGLVGSTGASTGPHLHFEVRTGAGPIDPLGWLPAR